MIPGMVLAGYYLVICLYLRRWDSPFPRVWAVLGGACVVWDVFQEEIPGGIRSGVSLAGKAALVLFVLVQCVIVSGMRERKPLPDCRWLIVLGARVDGKNLTDALKQRLDRAADWLLEHPETRVIVSGGQGPGEDITEASAMAAYLERRGIEKSRIWKEEASTTTRENLVYSGRILQREEGGRSWEEVPGTVQTGIVTNSFHLFRALFTARQVGFQKVAGLSAHTTWIMLPNYMAREFFGILKMLFQGKKKPD